MKTVSLLFVRSVITEVACALDGFYEEGISAYVPNYSGVLEPVARKSAVVCFDESVSREDGGHTIHNAICIHETPPPHTPQKHSFDS